MGAARPGLGRGTSPRGERNGGQAGHLCPPDFYLSPTEREPTLADRHSPVPPGRSVPSRGGLARAWVEKTGQGHQLRGTAGPHGSSGKPGAPALGRGSAQSGPEFGDKAGSSPTECSPWRGLGLHLSALPVARSGVIGHRGPRSRNTESCSPQRARDRREAPPAPRDDEVSPTLKCPRRQGSGYAASSEEGLACPRGHSGLVGRGLRTSALPTLPGRPHGPRPLAPLQPRAQDETHTPSPLVLVLWGHSNKCHELGIFRQQNFILSILGPKV